MAEPEQGVTEAEQGKPETDRRDFLRSCGKFAAITPPAVTFLLSTSMSSKAIAASTGRSSDKSSSIGAVLFGASAVPLGVAAAKRQAAPAAVLAPEPVSAVLPVEAPAPLEIPPAPPPPLPTGERG